MSIQHLQEQMREVYRELEPAFDQPNADALRKMILRLAEVVGHVVEHLEASEIEKTSEEQVKSKPQKRKKKSKNKNQINRKKFRGKSLKTRV
jgi:hypothetical protein